MDLVLRKLQKYHFKEVDVVERIILKQFGSFWTGLNQSVVEKSGGMFVGWLFMVTL